MTAGFQ